MPRCPMCSGIEVQKFHPGYKCCDLWECFSCWSKFAKVDMDENISEKVAPMDPNLKDYIENGRSSDKPAMSSAGISTGMVGLGAVMLIRGALYFTSFLKSEVAWVKKYKL